MVSCRDELDDLGDDDCDDGTSVSIDMIQMDISRVVLLVCYFGDIVRVVRLGVGYVTLWCNRN